MGAAELLNWGYGAIALVLLAISFLPELDVSWWWVRAMDVPRVQIAVAATGVLALSVLMPVWPVWSMAMLVVAILWQAQKIYPYTLLKRTEVQLADPHEDQIKLLSWNVLMDNTNYAKARDMIAAESPDVILLMETNQAWIDAMEPALKDYSTILRHPDEEYYGMLFASRLPTSEMRIVYLTEDETPSILVRMKAANGQEFRFVGLHPQPPLPGMDSDFRDRQMLYAARFARRDDLPIVSMGDFNAAAWSRESHRYKQLGEFVDPRVGRGLVASFDARSRVLRCPIDQLYITPDIALTGFHRGPDIGSDHFPMIATIRVDISLAARLNRAPPAMTADTRAALDQACEEHSDWLRKQHERKGIDPAFHPAYSPPPAD